MVGAKMCKVWSGVADVTAVLEIVNKSLHICLIRVR